MYIIFIFLVCISFLDAKENYKIVRGQTGENSSFEDILKKFRSSDVLILGEEHNDKNGHLEKLNLIEYLYSKEDFAISFEMLETDQQNLLDEYLLGYLDDSLFKENFRLWKNFEDDYKPILSFAKNKKISVIASNAPKRYVRLCSRNGLDYLQELPRDSLQYLSPLHSVTRFSQPSYNEKLRSLFSSAHSSANQSTKWIDNMIDAQNLWDATMAFSIQEHIKKNNRKVLHINGRFHSDEYLGVTYRLKQFGKQVVTVSMFPFPEKEKIETVLHVADFIVFTNMKWEDSSGEKSP